MGWRKASSESPSVEAVGLLGEEILVTAGSDIKQMSEVGVGLREKDHSLHVSTKKPRHRRQ